MTERRELRVAIHHHDGINNTPALDIATRGFVELRSAGLTLPHIPLGWDHNALTASVEQDIVGVLTYQHLAYMKELHVGVGYVEPAWCRNGIYGLLWAELVRRARDLKVVAVSSTTHIGNAAMQTVALRQGRREIGIVLRYDVPEADPLGAAL